MVRIKAVLKKFTQNPKLSIEMFDVNKVDVYKSWLWSNSFLRMCSARKALMVVKPSNEELIRPTSGLLAEKKKVYYLFIIPFNNVLDASNLFKLLDVGISNHLTVSNIQRNIIAGNKNIQFTEVIRNIAPAVENIS